MTTKHKNPSVARRLRGAVMNTMPLMITCVEFESFILNYLENSLPARQRRVFELHLKVCRECREYLAAYNTTVGVAKRTLTDGETDPKSDVPEDLIKAILAARDR